MRLSAQPLEATAGTSDSAYAACCGDGTSFGAGSSIGAGLMLQSFVRVQREDPGYQPANLLVADIDMASSTCRNEVARRVFFAQLLERVKAVPGVQSVCGTARFRPVGPDGRRDFRLWVDRVGSRTLLRGS